MTRDEIIEACSEAAHDAWYAEKNKRMQELFAQGKVESVSWPSETGEEQLVPWSQLSEPVRDFDRIVVEAIVDELCWQGEVRW